MFSGGIERDQCHSMGLENVVLDLIVFFDALKNHPKLFWSQVLYYDKSLRFSDLI